MSRCEMDFKKRSENPNESERKLMNRKRETHNYKLQRGSKEGFTVDKINYLLGYLQASNSWLPSHLMTDESARVFVYGS